MFQAGMKTKFPGGRGSNRSYPVTVRLKLTFILLLGLATVSPLRQGWTAEIRDSGTAAEQGAEGTPLLLAQADAGSEEREEMQELLAVLGEETEIATKFRMNNDYVPGMVTVLHGDELEALGVHTVLEALSLVPGVQISRIASGEPTVKVRGISFPFNAGNIKVMLNSIALSRESSGINSSVLLTPIAQVDRIEVIRGPGSTIYGDFAMSGVVNIITRNSGGRVFARGGDDHSRAGGGHYAYRNAEKDLALGLNLSAVDDGDNAANIRKNPDEARFLGVATLEYKKFTFTAEGLSRRVEVDSGPAPPPPPGTPPPPPPAGPGRSEQLERSWALQGRQKLTLGGANFDLTLGYLKNYSDTDEPAREFRGDRVDAGLDVELSPWSGHRLLLGLTYAAASIDHAADQKGLLTPGGTGEVDGITRRNYSLGMQDAISLGERFTLTLGLRYDNYNDVGGHLTPRIAGVYRLAEHHVIKAQYSEGFRAPTFWELYRTGSADDSLDFEVIKTGELSYIYRRPRQVARLTLYHSKIGNGLRSDPGQPFTNTAKIESQGVEVEWEQQLATDFRWQANLSYVDSRDNRWPLSTSDDKSPGIADWLGNLAAFWQPLPKLTVAGRLLYVGNRHATDGSVAGYELVDLTLSRSDLFYQGLTLRGGVKNLFDHRLVYTTQRPSGLSEDEFPGRTCWVQVAYDF